MELIPLINKTVLRRKRARSLRIELPNVFSASEAGECRRVLALRKLNRPTTRKEENEDEEARVEMLLADGTLHQSVLSSYIHAIPNVYLTNIEDARIKQIGTSGVYVTGHPDGVLYFAKEKKKSILEIKGLSRFLCQKLKSGDIETLKETYPKVIPQARTYMWLYEIDNAVILVKNKDTAALYEFNLGRSEEAEQRTLFKFVEVYNSIGEGAGKGLPPCDYMKGDRKCMFCPFPDECGQGR